MCTQNSCFLTIKCDQLSVLNKDIATLPRGFICITVSKLEQSLSSLIKNLI